jgi:hypothetical protein
MLIKGNYLQKSNPAVYHKGPTLAFTIFFFFAVTRAHSCVFALFMFVTLSLYKFIFIEQKEVLNITLFIFARYFFNVHIS